MKDRPFAATGVDYAGPFIVKQGEKDIKVWLCLFTCLMSRAVYLIVVEDLRSTTFLAALKELSARRSQPKMLISDNATTFVHGSKILAYIATQANVKKKLTNLNIEWKFTAAKASWTGGVYESLIGLVKRQLAKMLGNGLFTLQDFRNCVISVESLLNNRPLCRTSEQEIITPAHILNGSGAVEGVDLTHPIAEQVIQDVLKARKQLPDVYRDLKDRQDKFWEALQNQYLETLKFTQDKMSNRFKTQAKVGDVCLVYSDQPRLKWKMAVISKLTPSSDGQHRQAVIKMANGTTTRPLNHLYPLELEVEDFNDQSLAEQQLSRAKKNERPLKDLKTKIKRTALSQEIPQTDINNIIDKMDEEIDPSQHVPDRPRRQAAIRAASLRKEMVRQNIL